MVRQFPQFMFGGALLCAGVALLAHSYLAPGVEGSIGVTYGPMFYPRVLLWTWVLLSCGVMIEGALGKGQSPSPQCWQGVIVSVSLTLVAAFLFPMAGFVPVSVIFVAAYAYLLGFRRRLLLLCVSVAYASGVWFVFNKILGISLPEIPFN